MQGSESLQALGWQGRGCTLGARSMGRWHLSPECSLLGLLCSVGISPCTRSGHRWGQCRCNHTHNRHAKFLPWRKELRRKYSNLNKKKEKQHMLRFLLSFNFISSYLANFGTMLEDNTVKLLKNGRAHMGFPEHTDITLNQTELAHSSSWLFENLT